MKFAAAALLLAMGFVEFGMVPGLQMRVMRYAVQTPPWPAVPTHAAFNIGNFLGVWISGPAISAGEGFRPPLVGRSGFRRRRSAALGVAGRSADAID